MRAIILIGVVAGLAGCVKTNECERNTIFVTYTLGAAATSATTLDVSVAIDGGAAKTSQVQLARAQTSGSVLVEFPHGYPSGKTVDVTITAKAGQTPLLTGHESKMLSAACEVLSITVGDAPGDLATNDGASPLDGSSDMKTAPDANSDDLSPEGDMVCVPAFSACPASIGCGMASDGCGMTYDCGPCQLSAIAPAIANSGDTLSLEGTFGQSATVTFPGGAVATATILGPHRASVVVPATGGGGDLTITTSGQVVGPIYFRRASFGLGLQNFSPRYAQTDLARQMPALSAQDMRFFIGAIRIGKYLYLIGVGADGKAISRALVNIDGTLGAFHDAGVSVDTVRLGCTMIRIANFVYLIADSVARATIQADGSLSSFSAVAGVAPQIARVGGAASLCGNRLYLLGGGDKRAEYAIVDAAGALTNFTIDSGTCQRN